MNVFVLLNTKEDILKNEGNRAVLDHSILFPTIEVNGAQKTAWLQTFFRISSLCSAERTHSYRFGTIWGWVNGDIIFIVGWAMPLSRVLAPGRWYNDRTNLQTHFRKCKTVVVQWERMLICKLNISDKVFKHMKRAGNRTERKSLAIQTVAVDLLVEEVSKREQV